MTQGQNGLALLAFVGGLSSATAMVVVAAIALSTMVCNDLVMPVLLRIRWLKLDARGDLTQLLLFIRRAGIFAVLLLGYAYYRVTGESGRAGPDRPRLVRRRRAVRCRRSSAACSGRTPRGSARRSD